MDRELIDDCVHCGFCLPACPTYSLWGEEMDSPRGRIYLMKTALEGDTPIDSTWVGHMDACLGCMACVPACPSGVKYGELIESARATIERDYRRPWRDRLFRSLLFRMFPGRRRLRLAAALGWLYQRSGLATLVRRSGVRGRLPARLQALESLMPSTTLRAVTRRTPRLTPAEGERRQRVGFLTGCIQEVFFGDVNAATVRVLAAEGCEVVAPPAQGCCGALELHGGREAGALDRARSVVDVFAPLELDAIVVNAAGCGSALKDYGRLLADDPDYAERAAAFAGKVRDVTEVLAGLPPRQSYGQLDVTVAYHDACHLANAQRITSEPRNLLQRVPGLQLRPVLDDGICCGSAGIYNLVEPEAAGELGRRKAEALASTGAQMVVTTNPGCALQIARELDRPVVHPVQILASALGERALEASSS
ncbi:4Fe-4S dicluster domain-containing protein [Actinobacteria bacterium YIM 96077]|uniref:Glycolate oxidase iron-sulfur subunit n=1 Tax=Phytoactinopolyspora halophila TaxID=1981511 RepID=A0A329QY58_9ACTN|nr:heterodisulfide reductase-related iron-sulfur binding cluster [Phytoactinopolyspora halophila]AYY13879.1 4Fe-4S dicluster domain-containing protein [Actinobacteria bacterium YIM 96077]RAW15578.1 glycolate oxidase [Phytoactinopolyspora halophila]